MCEGTRNVIKLAPGAMVSAPPVRDKHLTIKVNAKVIGKDATAVAFKDA